MARRIFDLDKFRSLIEENGMGRDEAAEACGVAASGINTLLRRQGYQIDEDVKLRLAPYQPKQRKRKTA
jgi:hypothetical protein